MTEQNESDETTIVEDTGKPDWHTREYDYGECPETEDGEHEVIHATDAIRCDACGELLASFLGNRDE